MPKFLEIIQGALAWVLDKFKAGSPFLFAVIALVLSVGHYAIDQGILTGVFPDSPALQKAMEWLLWAGGIFLGSRTTPYLKSKTSVKEKTKG